MERPAQSLPKVSGGAEVGPESSRFFFYLNWSVHLTPGVISLSPSSREESHSVSLQHLASVLSSP